MHLVPIKCNHSLYQKCMRISVDVPNQHEAIWVDLTKVSGNSSAGLVHDGEKGDTASFSSF